MRRRLVASESSYWYIRALWRSDDRGVAGVFDGSPPAWRTHYGILCGGVSRIAAQHSFAGSTGCQQRSRSDGRERKCGREGRGAPLPVGVQCGFQASRSTRGLLLAGGYLPVVAILTVTQRRAVFFRKVLPGRGPLRQFPTGSQGPVPADVAFFFAIAIVGALSSVASRVGALAEIAGASCRVTVALHARGSPNPARGLRPSMASSPPRPLSFFGR